MNSSYPKFGPHLSFGRGYHKAKFSFSTLRRIKFWILPSLNENIKLLSNYFFLSFNTKRIKSANNLIGSFNFSDHDCILHALDKYSKKLLEQIQLYFPTGLIEIRLEEQLVV
ncbi:hypothetical protein Glove_350g180 [Diversispora epigaea]|uniref:Uncharacterized protein n=1 Tax=Diversispora epigaea TaxID=1348612 RepID=A0A397HCS7_9GLOM|nr:hypothetical protein Glove_350g180 [Diversispora epigaea]